jgi:fucose permease
MPALRAKAHVTTAEIGLGLVLMAAGSISASLLASSLVPRWGVQRCITAGSILSAVGLAWLAVSQDRGSLFGSLLVVGLGGGLWDVAMNEEAGQHSRESGVMFRCHGFFSVGMVLGALVGAMCAQSSVDPATHLTYVSFALAALVVVRLVTSLSRETEHVHQGRSDLDWWRVVALALVLFGAAFAEGIANEWLTIIWVDGYRVPHATAAVALSLFIAIMTVVRLIIGFFPAVLRVRQDVILLLASVLITSGTVAVYTGASFLHGSVQADLLAMLGVVLWGLGAGPVFPLVIAAAVRGRGPSASSVAVVTAVGYGSFLVAPGVMGLVSDSLGVVFAVLIVPVVVVATFGPAAMIHSSRSARERVRRAAAEPVLSPPIVGEVPLTPVGTVNMVDSVV